MTSQDGSWVVFIIDSSMHYFQPVKMLTNHITSHIFEGVYGALLCLHMPSSSYVGLQRFLLNKIVALILGNLHSVIWCCIERYTAECLLLRRGTHAAIQAPAHGSAMCLRPFLEFVSTLVRYSNKDSPLIR